MKLGATIACFLGFLLMLLAGCGARSIPLFEREHLFDLEIGKMENQLDLLLAQGLPYDAATRVRMRDGIFYIANGNANKVMEFTSYGDLLGIVFDPDENPRPVSLQSPRDGLAASRRAHSYPFLQTGAIAITNDKTMLVEDRLPPERSIFDDQLDVILNRIVLRFSPSGRVVDYIGQEGIGGTPFPFIHDIHVNRNDEIIVLSRTMTSWLVYWFSADGDARFTVEIALDRLPIPGDETDVVAMLETVVPGFDHAELYLKLNYYRRSHDETTGARSGITMDPSRVYRLDLTTGRYEDFFEVPANRRRVSTFNPFDREEVEFHYELIGVGPGRNLFFLSREIGNSAQLLIQNASGRVVRRRTLTIEDDEIEYSAFSVSPEGILVGLLAWHDVARVVWWRTDRLIGSTS